MKKREAKELHKKQINNDIKIRKEIKPFVDGLWLLNHSITIINNIGISYNGRDAFRYYIPLIQDLYIQYNYGSKVANRFIPKYSILDKRKRYKKHLYA